MRGLPFEVQSVVDKVAVMKRSIFTGKMMLFKFFTYPLNKKWIVPELSGSLFCPCVVVASNSNSTKTIEVKPMFFSICTMKDPTNGCSPIHLF